jgi:uncharacterized protein with LGFP repeats
MLSIKMFCRIVFVVTLLTFYVSPVKASVAGCEYDGCAGNYDTILGNMDGVNIRSNGSCTGHGTGCNQCVDLVQDYFSLNFGVSLYGNGNAAGYYDKAASRSDLARYANGNTTTMPQRGDILGFDDGGFGHVGLCKEVGAEYLIMCDQNRTSKADCIRLNLRRDPYTGIVTVSTFNAGYKLEGWIRGVVNGKPVSPPGGGSSDPLPTQPPPKFTRAFALGQGTGTPEAWVEGWQKVGGFNELGIPTTAPAWDNNYVVQKFTRPDSGIQSALIHDQNHNVPYAWAIVDAFYSQWLAYGGMPVVGAPISNKYNVAPGVDYQDFTNARITHDGSGFHLIMHYPFGYTPGQGSSNPGAFQFGYTQAGGNAFGNPTSAISIKNGFEVQAYQDPNGKNVWMVLNPGYLQAFGVKGYIYDAWMASGNVFGGWVNPISIEYYVGPNQTMQWFRYGAVYKNDKNVVTFTAATPAGTRLFAPGEGIVPDRAAHMITAFERSGGVGKLGGCTAKYDISGFNYQYCSGGGYSGRAAIVLNYAANNYVAIVVRGSIEAYWESTGGISGSMGVPYTEEYPSKVMVGSTGEEFGHTIDQHYDYAEHLLPYPYGYALGDGATYWSAFAIMRRYDTDAAGYPKTWIYWSGQGQVEDFGGGLYSGKVSYIHDATSRAARAYLVKGGIGSKWWGLGGGNSYLGLPVTDEIQNGTKITQYFQYGVISGDTNTAVYQDRKY